MFPLLRFFLFLSFGSMFLTAETLGADEPLHPPQRLARTGSESAPTLPQPKTDNASLDKVRAMFSNSRVASQQIRFAGASTQSERQEIDQPEERSPLRGVSHASFSTPPMATPLPAPDEEYFDDAPDDESLDDEHVFDTTLDKPLFSKKLAKEEGEPTEDEEPKSGWTNKLVKPELTPVLSVTGSLLIVVAAFFLLVILFRKVSPQGSRPLPKEAFECLGRHFLSQKHQLQVLRLGNRIVLVSVMPDGVATLAEITDPDEVVALLGHFRRLDSNSATEIFRKTVASLSEDELNRLHARPAAASRQRESAGSLDLYSDPDESLASLLARGRNLR